MVTTWALVHLLGAFGSAGPAASDGHVGAVHTTLRARMKGFDAAEMAAVARVLEESSVAYNLDPYLLLGLISVESSFRRHRSSGAGALGLMQLLPSTAVRVARTQRVEWWGPETLYDPVRNVRLGAAYLRRLLNHYQGRLDWALTAYCHGPGRVRKALRDGGISHRMLRYSRKVHAARHRLMARSVS